MKKAHDDSAETTDPGEKGDSLADAWLKRIKNNPLIAVLIVGSTVLVGVLGFSEKVLDFYEKHVRRNVQQQTTARRVDVAPHADKPTAVQPPSDTSENQKQDSQPTDAAKLQSHKRRVHHALSLAAFNLSAASDMYFGDEPYTCRFDGRNVRTFMPPASAKSNRPISLDFVFKNDGPTDAILTGLDVDVSAAEQVSGGQPGVVVPNHTYVVNLEHRVGTQSFLLNPVYKVPAKDTGAFSILFMPATKGIGLCWIMTAVFHTTDGDLRSDPFSLIMSNF
jgi:hypothetical protein